MPAIFSIFELILLIGISQGMVASILLLTAKKNHLSKRLLGNALLLLCIVNFRIIFHNLGWSDITQIRFMPLGWELFIPPLVYFYVLSLTQSNFTLNRTHYLQFLPGAFFTLYDFFIFIATLTTITITKKDQLALSLYYHQVNQVEDYIIVISSLFYTFMSLKCLSVYQQKIQPLNNHASQHIYQWLKQLFILTGCVAILLFINEMLDAFILPETNTFFHWNFFNLYLAVTIYYLGFKGYRLEESPIHSSKKQLELMARKLDNKNNSQTENKLIEQIETYKIYLDHNITLIKLAEIVETTPENLSFLINQKFNKNFRDLINYYRINEVKQKLIESKADKTSILNLALESGFNSQASFYRAFKKFEKITPKAYLSSKN